MHIYKTHCPQKDWWPNPASDEVPSLNDPDIRADLVRRVRRQIAEGTYDIPEKFALALDRLMKELES